MFSIVDDVIGLFTDVEDAVEEVVEEVVGEDLAPVTTDVLGYSLGVPAFGDFL